MDDLRPMTEEEVAAYTRGIQDADAMIGALWVDLFNKDLVKAAGADYFDRWRGRIRALAITEPADGILPS